MCETNEYSVIISNFHTHMVYDRYNPERFMTRKLYNAIFAVINGEWWIDPDEDKPLPEM